jgi:hypothetical protein
MTGSRISLAIFVETAAVLVGPEAGKLLALVADRSPKSLMLRMGLSSAKTVQAADCCRCKAEKVCEGNLKSRLI